MRKNSSQTNPFDDFDLWDVPVKSDQSRNVFQEPSKAKTDDLSDFYDFAGSVPRKPTKHRRSIAPIAAGIALLIILAAGGLILGSRFLAPEPGETRPVIQTFPSATFPVVTVPPTVPATEPPTVPATEPATEPFVPPQPSVNRYFRSRLTAEEQAVYDIIEDGIAAAQTSIGPFNLTHQDRVKAIVQAVQYDNARYFWFRGGYNSSYYDRPGYVEMTILPIYSYPANEIAAKDAFVRSAIQPVLDDLKGKSDYEKVLGVYDYLVDHTIYDLAYTGKTPYELFFEGRAVCEGYARAAQYLLTELGVETLYVVGVGGKMGQESQWGSHAWNIVCIEGEYYQMDVTWGDPVTTDGTQTKSYNYLLLTDQEMSRRHRADNPHDYPVCASTTWNYHALQGKLLPTFQKSIIEEWFYEAVSQGQTMEFKAADEDTYRQAVQWLVTEDGINQLYRAIEPYAGYRYQYDCHDDTLVISVTIYTN